MITRTHIASYGQAVAKATSHAPLVGSVERHDVKSQGVPGKKASPTLHFYLLDRINPWLYITIFPKEGK